MSNVPAELKYTKDHEWIKIEADGTATVGITDYAQESLGDITFVELPEVGAVFGSGETFGVVESVKAASDLYAPVACEVLEVNETLDGEPELLNSDPYKAAWIMKIKVTGDEGDLLSDSEYKDLL
jgi:glycine cleavage system H protein